MKAVYINSVGSVSAQKTFNNEDFLEEIVTYNDTTIRVIEPDYKAYITPAAARRMAKGIKMSTVSAKTAMEEAGVENIDAIIVGTGLGCIGDSEKFVSAIIDNKEQFLTPTRFIQSSHNTVSGQIALGVGCKGYNFTYVHSAISFESSLLDALMQIRNKEATNILVGGVDELVDHHVDTHRLIDHIKHKPVDSSQLLQSNSKGCVMAEGAHFFVLSGQKQSSTYGELVAITTYNTLSKSVLSEKVSQFLGQNGLTPEELDLAIFGNNGDIDFDSYYELLGKGIFKNTPQAYYKHLSGEFDTASGFGFWLAAKILKSQTVPTAVKLNQLEVSRPKTILLYNQYRGENHSLVLLRRC
ncbi:3-oxoacyl-ACP synthase [Flavobacteriaceae bacterium TP-CH-4]|uniref:3-oxoacyl-ACP synthase n=1 Tax=Pelagihabitans pacificus TaxID=2696054 RepID=A0A967AUE2_9FLAO|nr:beta-ketoacyl synthase N-terminal-like domain-containing protein [Pelagihabitans pacificus]NHF60561.1 3-oxoacyl-ACP synthase [Pelagihabitans pacificus]